MYIYINIYTFIYTYVYIYIYIYTYIYIYIYTYIPTCYMYVVRVGVPNMQNMHNMLANVGHRVGHQTGLDENSGRNSTTFLNGFAFRGYLVFSKICTIIKDH